MIATTKEQSERLVKCGVSSDTADMCYDSGALSLMQYNSAINERDIRRENYEVLPAWSLSRMLELLPKRLRSYYRRGGYYQMVLTIVTKDWCLSYREYDFSLKAFFGESPIEACVKAVEWLTSNGYKLNEVK